MEKVIGRENPKVGLVNIGAEASKGSTLTKAAYELLEQSKMNFIGNVEAREVPEGACDVIVTDGFTGNVLLKLTEGMALNILKLLKKKFTEGTKAKLGAALLIDKIRDIKQDFDYSEYGGAPYTGRARPYSQDARLFQCQCSQEYHNQGNSLCRRKGRGYNTEFRT